MPPKRSSPSEELTGRERKKQKTAVARTIAVQSDHGASKGAGTAEAGPSKSVRFDSMKGLPGALDVERFTEARAFEIKAMHEAMQNARSNSTQRAWQQLPRHLRRRAASHDVRRVPLRLRDKARAEMDPARRKALGRSNPKIGKLKRIKRTADLLRRQKDKVWLETHMWHAKRMHMENMWGYRLAVTPTEKSFRPSHRASVNGSILHDASYFATIELKGPEDLLHIILDSCCDCQGPSVGAKRFTTGTRTVETFLYGYNKYPYGLIGPATLLWRADSQLSAADQAPAITRSKGKGKEKVTSADTTDPHRIRIVWVRVHAAMVEDAHEALRLSTSFALDSTKEAGRVAEVEIADLREHFNIFEIVGPKSSQVIKGALKPVDDKRADFKKFWASLDRIQSAGSVPRGMVIGFTVYDPRLNFPPKNAKLQIDERPNLSPASTVFPSSVLAQSQIWDEQTRLAIRKPRHQKKDLDERRSHKLIPGIALKAERNDDRVPVLLIQRSVENPSLSQDAQSPRLTSTTALHGWTLIVPQGWGMPFFSSLTYTGTRTGGQRERQTQSFEAGCTHFPRDFPCTPAYADYAADRADAERDAWTRRPPAKRPNYDALGTRSPWCADWPIVLGLAPSPGPEETEEFVDTQRAPPASPAAAPGGPKEGECEPWLLRGPDVPVILRAVASMLSPAPGLLAHLNQARAKRKLAPLAASTKAEEVLRGALVQVSVALCARGCPDDLAAIYRLEDGEVREWIRAEARRKNGTAAVAESPDETELSQVSASADGIIGYVTTGSFSLSLGQGHAVGAIPFAQYLELRKQAQRLRNEPKLLVKLRNRDETLCRAAYLELLH